MNKRLPPWFKQKLPDLRNMSDMQDLIDDLQLHTVCESALCPNSGECFSNRTATFLILGENCTRNCTFCAVANGRTQPPDPTEPVHILEAAEKLELSYIIITSVTRDDLADGGASQFVEAIILLRSKKPVTKIEVLIPDFLKKPGALSSIIAANPDVIAHNLETVPRLYKRVRPGADYGHSVNLLAKVKETDEPIITKSSLMLGLGETKEEVTEVMSDLREAGCNILTLGQYLQPSEAHHPVEKYLPPAEFLEYADIGKQMGFSGIASAPLVRSSYRAAELFNLAKTSIHPISQRFNI